MRKVLAVASLAAVLSSCGSATAASRRLDPTSDLDCAITAYVFYVDATQKGAPEKPTQELRIAAEWFGGNMKARGYEPTGAQYKAVSNLVLADAQAAKAELKGCMDRATRDSRFSTFVERRGWRG